MEIINDRMDKISMLKNRDVERQQNIKKKKEDKDLIAADNEKLEYFETIFAENKNRINSLIDNSANVPQSELPNHFNIISKEILTLQKYVAASNLFLRSYDIKRCQTNIQELIDRAREFEEQFLPKKKFGFKNKLKSKSHDSNLNGKAKAADEVDFKKFSKSFQYGCGLFNKKNETLEMSGQEIFKKDVSVEKLEDCKVIFKGSPSTLHLNYLTNCLVFTGPVSTSIFAENCENCTLVIACQQLRLHSSKNVKIYLHVTSRAIMEDCKQIYFAPYNLKYEGLEEDFEKAGLDNTVNNWKCVDDFNWLNIEKKSPNWHELEEESRVSEWRI